MGGGAVGDVGRDRVQHGVVDIVPEELGEDGRQRRLRLSLRLVHEKTPVPTAGIVATHAAVAGGGAVVVVAVGPSAGRRRAGGTGGAEPGKGHGFQHVRPRQVEVRFVVVGGLGVVVVSAVGVQWSQLHPIRTEVRSC